jgi:DNA-directed RNA polymerase subunit K
MATKKAKKKATKKTGKKTSKITNFTRFERARIIGARALQISMGAKPMVDVTPDLDPIDNSHHGTQSKGAPLDVRAMESR